MRKRKKQNNWKRLLLHMYNNQKDWSYITEEIKYLNEDKNPIIKKLKISRREFQASFDFLIDLELIEKRKENKYYILSKKGLDLVLEIEKNKRDEEYKEIIIYLTILLVIPSIISLFNTFNENFIKGVLILLIIIFLIIPLIIKNKKQNAINTNNFV